ncbi:ATP-binding protein [Nonomuraea sp. FMUSA5-5]|uniref:ATP-binding protein n=1 Tax=Nonomuraea composti TaxID=2720023 RepID=A0ABX1AVR8_9ACTN|nr:ATP-binding protein [Nonomuraea sp. FMUSA5-5]NJP88712.1 ATP-binding protein [Nonomuraea sp. FMUSA5-5]
MSGMTVLRFDEHCLNRTRHVLRVAARHRGLRGERLDDFLIAINECVVNAVEHGGGQGWLALWRADGVLLCEVRDRGPGIPAPALADAPLPPPGAPGGRGIWLMRRLADEAVFTTGPAGTAVRLGMRLPCQDLADPVAAREVSGTFGGMTGDVRR